MSFHLESPAFVENSPIPAKYTCDGENVSPPLFWVHPPAPTACFALLCEDPDAPGGTWVHWVIYNIPPLQTHLPEAVPVSKENAQGLNDFKRSGYGGPCPPKGPPHHYYFILYALDTLLSLPQNASKKELIQAMQGHILAKTQLMGTYAR